MNASDPRFTVNWDAVDPFDPDYPHLWVKVEHLGRYLFAARYLLGVGADGVMDAACGAGYGARELASTAQRVIAIDGDADLIREAQERYQASSVTYRQAALGSGELLRVAAGSASLDAIVCFEALEHLTDPARALREFRALVSVSSHLILSVPNGTTEGFDEAGLPSNPLHKRVFSVSSITELLHSCGFEVLQVLGQPLANQINQNETRLIRRKQTDGRIGDEPAMHEAQTIRRLALAIGYPEARDVERSYSFTIVARAR